MPSNSARMSPRWLIGTPDLADLAAGQLVVGVVAGLGRQVEGDRQAGLALGQVAPVQRVGLRAPRSARRRCASPTARHAWRDEWDCSDHLAGHLPGCGDPESTAGNYERPARRRDPPATVGGVGAHEDAVAAGRRAAAGPAGRLTLRSTSRRPRGRRAGEPRPACPGRSHRASPRSLRSTKRSPVPSSIAACSARRTSAAVETSRAPVRRTTFVPGAMLTTISTPPCVIDAWAARLVA